MKTTEPFSFRRTFDFEVAPISIFNCNLLKTTNLPAKVNNIVICKFCRKKQFDTVINRVMDIYKGADITIYAAAPYRKNDFENILYNQKMVDENLATEKIVDSFRKADLCFSAVSFEIPVYGDLFTANVFRFLRSIKQTRSYFIDKNFNLFSEQYNITNANHGVDVFANLTSNEQEFLYKTVKDSKLSGNIVEIGRAAGGSTCIMASALKKIGRDEKLFSYDIQHVDLAAESIRNLQLEDYVKVFTVSSATGASQWKESEDGKARLIFIDADDAYESIVEYLRSWTPHLAPGGTVAIHDYGNVPGKCYDVERAVYDALIITGEYQNFGVIDCLFYAEKKP